MKAVVLTRAGSPDRLALTDVPEPVPGPTDVLIRINATTVTRGDVIMRKLPKLVARLVGATPKSILGHEFAGEIEAVGRDVRRFNFGDRVFGTTTGLSQGAHAEYVRVPEDGVLVRLPPGIAAEDAAPLPVGGMAALHFVREGGAGPEKHVLVNGASGSVGSFAVQIAKHLGARVTGVTSASNLDLVASLGADEVIDYRQQDFTRDSHVYDVIFDAVGKASRRTASRVLAPGGRFVTTQARRGERVEDLLTLRELASSGSIRAVIDRTFTFQEMREAHRYVEGGHKRGNVLIRVTA